MTEDKRCWLCKKRKPRTAEFWHRNRTAPDGFQSQCKACVNEGLVNGTPRAEQGKGVYLAILLLANGTFVIKVGKTGDGKRGFRSRAGTLAEQGRATGLDVIWAEILYVIDLDHADARTSMEEMLLDLATPVYATEYFRGEEWDTFVGIFAEKGRPYTERTTHAVRRQEFLDWLMSTVAA